MAFISSPEGTGMSRSQLDKVFVPYPAHFVGGVVLVFRQPKLPFLTNDIEYLRVKDQLAHGLTHPEKACHKLTSPAL